MRELIFHHRMYVLLFQSEGDSSSFGYLSYVTLSCFSWTFHLPFVWDPFAFLAKKVQVDNDQHRRNQKENQSPKTEV